jgi:membrane-bound lytic murein transglycosylase A|tara:strand:+ start:1813 stop:2985 length:1173 start_codon:yes stop_codon:yes gene_type:complete
MVEQGLVLALALLFLASCAPKPERPDQLVLTPVKFADLPGWATGRPIGALGALRRSCEHVVRDKANAVLGTEFVPLTKQDWEEPCSAAKIVSAGNGAVARSYFEKFFQAFYVAGENESEGLFTGYFEVVLSGSKFRDGAHSVPIYRLPKDRISADLGDFDIGLRGKKIIGRVAGGKFVPYFKRAEIESGVLGEFGLELIWLNDPIDAFVLHVQGSGRVNLPDGKSMRVGFAGHNGHPYSSIGRALIGRGELSPNKASWDDIRNWLEANPDKRNELFAINSRYIFFREIAGDGPIGAQGVALTPGRSLAVDRKFIPLGLPIWLDTVWPNDAERQLQRLMVSQDTGGAIKGQVRGDVFWGHGKQAAKLAGKMKSRGRYYIFLPKSAAQRLGK